MRPARRAPWSPTPWLLGLVVGVSVALSAGSAALGGNNAANNNAANGNAAGGNNNAGGNAAGGNNNAGGNAGNAANGGNAANANVGLGGANNAAPANGAGNAGGNAAGGNAAGGGFGNALGNTSGAGANAAGGNAAGGAGGNPVLGNAAAPANGAGNAALGNPSPLNSSGNAALGNAALGSPTLGNPAAPANAAPANANGNNANANAAGGTAPVNAAVSAAAAAAAKSQTPTPPKPLPWTPANGKYEMRFQFDQNGQPSVHTYRLKWGGPENNLQAIDVLAADTDDVIQTIQVPQDQVHLVWRDLIGSKPGIIKEKFLDSVDYNFDKYADLRLLRQWPYKVGKKAYLIWLFDDHLNQYVPSKALSALTAPQPNPKTRRIEATDLGAWGGGEYVTKEYSINPAGKLKIQSKVTQTIKDRMRLTFVRDVRVRVEGELQRVCKIVVPAEGMPKQTWGDKAKCARFLVKGPPTNNPPLAPVQQDMAPKSSKAKTTPAKPVGKAEPLAH